jgi:hypothetical protein
MQVSTTRDYIRVISREADGTICGIHEIPGDRHSWRYWWPVVREGDRCRAASFEIGRVPVEREVNVHAFKIEQQAGEEVQTHCEANDPALAGWSVYLREQRGEEIDIPIDRDFTGPAADVEAAVFAAELTERYGCEAEVY